jgi:cupin 2 domain-containing protein
MTNIFNIDKSLLQGDEVFEEIIRDKNVRIQRVISYGHVSPDGFWYDQPENEWVILLQGKAKITFQDNKETNLQKGDSIFLPAHQRHRVSYTSKKPACIWLTVFWK